MVLCRDSDWTEELGWVQLNHNEPAFYCVPAKHKEELMDLVDDLELNRLTDSRLADGQDPLRVSLAAL